MAVFIHRNQVLGNVDTIGELSDVNITNVLDEDMLTFNGNTNKWENKDSTHFQQLAQATQEAAEDAEEAKDMAIAAAQGASFSVDFTTGNVMYTNEQAYSFNINTTTGNLEWEVVT